MSKARYRVKLYSTNGGSIECSNEATNDLTWGTIYVVDHGDTITFTAVPTKGYRFSHWSDDENNTDLTRTVTITENTSYTAYFELDKINNILADTSQSLGVLVDLGKEPEILADGTKVYG